MKRSTIIPATLLLLWHTAAIGCLWDRDTLRMELKGNPDLLEIITGRFERNPPEFFEHRLRRATEELATAPERLDLYDDAAVACDRLNRADEAIAWLEKKRAVLDQMPENAASLDHRYRYHANLGTVLAHRWLRAGARVESISEMTAARNEIARAIELNPNAHFGREKYQLMAMDWIIKISDKGFDFVRSDEFQDPRSFVESEFSEEGDWHPESELPPGLADSVEGISGLVYLGNAWQSIDVFYALQRVLQASGNNSIALLAQLRRLELESAGAVSLFPTRLIARKGSEYRNVNAVAKESPVTEFFHKARAEADRWHETRTLYMKKKIAEGSHPDTDIDFWEDFSYRGKAPKLRPGWGDLSQKSQSTIGLSLFAAVVLGVPFLLIQIVRRLLRLRRAA